MWVDDDLERALTAYQAADAAGLSDSLLLSSYSMVLERMRRDDEAYELARRAVALDPANTFLICTSAIEYSILGRFLEGMRLIDRGLDIYPERRFLRLVRGQIIFLNTGRLEDLLLELDAASRQQPPSAILDLSFRVLVCARAYDELERLLESIPEDEVRAVPGPAGGGSLFGVGKRPLSHLRGWVALLRGDSSEAARQGTAVLEFLERTKTTRLNAWFRHALAADGHTFLGQREAAIAAARVTLEAMVPARDSFARFSIYHSARVLAWNGLHDEAVSLFEGDSSVNMRPTTALITRDPSITTPLAGNARFQALSQRIEGVLAERAALLDSYLGPR
jgi:tetratricopeptide (TPR) repeat protein